MQLIRCTKKLQKEMVLKQSGLCNEEQRFFCLGPWHANLIHIDRRKSVLGSMNDLAFHYKYSIMEAGGVHSYAVPEIIHRLNRMPMGSLKYVFPIEALRALYQTKER
jgi:hypothetical protein